jgi:hypothetical protein
VAQQVTVGTPFNTISDSFYESTNLSWGLSGRGWSFRFGGGGVPAYGGYNPSAAANFGWGFQHGNLNGWFAGSMGQGCRRGIVSQTPSITLTDGVPGYVSDSSQSPFVMGVVPVVGNCPTFNGAPTLASLNPTLPPPVLPNSRAAEAWQNAVAGAQAQRDAAEAQQVVAQANRAANRPAERRGEKPDLQDDLVLMGPAAQDAAQDNPGASLKASGESSAARPAPSVAEARRRYEAEQAEAGPQVVEYLERARHAEAMGKPAVARQYYQMAYRRASGSQRDEIRAKLLTLPASKSTAE